MGTRSFGSANQSRSCLMVPWFAAALRCRMRRPSGPVTTTGRDPALRLVSRRTNPFLLCPDVDAFLQLRTEWQDYENR